MRKNYNRGKTLINVTKSELFQAPEEIFPVC